MPDEQLRRRREATIAALLEIERTGELDRLQEVFPHPRYELIGNNRVYDGLAVCTRYLRERRIAFPDYAAELIALYHADDAVIAEAWVTGTHLGRIEDFDPTGKGFRFRAAAFFLFDGEILTCFRNYFDHATIARQLA
ncbi:MAG: ester cyclase [Acidimicrobiales bacterium]